MRNGIVALCCALLAAACTGLSAAAECVVEPAAGRSGSVEQSWNDLEGRPVALSSYRGRVVVLNFWATWCRPCVAEMPELAALQRRHGSRGLQVIGASADAQQRVDAVRRFTRRHDIPFPVLVGATTAHMEQLGLPPALPGTVILDREGFVAVRCPGVIEADELDGILRDLLDGVPLHEGAGAEQPGNDGSDEHGTAEHHHRPAGEASLVPS